MPLMKKKVVPNTGKNAGKEIEVNKYYYSSKDKPVAVIMGCFSPFTGKKGHGKQLETAINSGIDEFVLAIVPKKEKIDSDRNMFTLEQKKDIAEEAIKSLGYKLIDSFIAQKSFGASILKEVAERHPDRRIVLICGPDREDEYSKFCRKYDPKNSQKPGIEKDDYEYILNDPGKENIRGTAVRQTIKDNDRDLFIKLTGYTNKMWTKLRDYAKKNGVKLVESNLEHSPEVAREGVKKIEKWVTSIKNPNTGKPNELYYVGGCVRDELLGKEPKDFDLLTTMEGKEFENAPIWDSADHMFRTGKVIILGYMDGECFEVNTIYPDPKHEKGIVNNLNHRDVTVNAIAKNVSTGELVDPLNGIKDIKNKVIRATDTTMEKFRNGKEPVRIIRVLRFIGYFGPDWKISQDTKDALIQFSKVNKGKCKIPPGQFADNWNKIKFNKDKIIQLIKEIGFHDYFMENYPDYAADN